MTLKLCGTSVCGGLLCEGPLQHAVRRKLDRASGSSFLQNFKEMNKCNLDLLESMHPLHPGLLTLSHSMGHLQDPPVI